MITSFVCNKPECPNEGIIYNFEDAILKAECGGCHATLLPIKEEQ